MDRYGGAIEYDLHGLGLDLVDFFRGAHSWRKLGNLLARLPAWSAYWEAQANDDEYADFILSLPPQETDHAPGLSYYTPEVARLTDLKDQLGVLISLVVQGLGGKPGRPQMSARPRTAIDRLRERKRGQRHAELVNEIDEAQKRWAEKNTL